MSVVLSGDVELTVGEATEFQAKCIALIKRGLNGQLDISTLAHHLKTSRLAVYSAMKSAEKKSLVGSIRSRDDRWGVIVYFVREVRP
jgi:DNA-binding MarR family transcriptional regulator